MASAFFQVPSRSNPSKNFKPTTVAGFDPDSPDAQIFEAFEAVRSNKAWTYGFDGVPEKDQPTEEMERRANQQVVDEDQVTGNFATTIPGAICKLMLLIPATDQSRWVDAGMADQGFLALYRHRDELDGHAQQIADAVNELLHIQWRTALAAYEKSAVDFDLALRGKGIVDSEKLDANAAPQLVGRLSAYFDEVENRFSNQDEIRRVVRTLVPDHAAYLRKVEIIIAENYQEDATPWLARDTNFLVGRIERNEPAEESR